MKLRRRLITVSAVVAVAMAGAVAPADASRPPDPPEASQLASFGSGLGSGSTIGPDGALYVTDGNAGSVVRIDPDSGRLSTFASGLPRQVLGIGGATDVAFVGRTAYVLVTMVGGDLLLPTGTVHFGDATDGIYRLNKDGTSTVIADIGAWSAAHAPTLDFFITTGVQYALQRYCDGFVVTDGHHNRVLRVGLDGRVTEMISFGNIVPTGLEVSNVTVYVAEAGPIPHRPQDAKVVAVNPRAMTVADVASGPAGEGAGLAVDVERGPRHRLYSLLQGVWDLPIVDANAGAPASHDSGALVRIERDGTFTTIVDHLDQPTSLEFLGNTALIVTLAGRVIRIDHVSDRTRDHSH